MARTSVPGRPWLVKPGATVRLRDAKAGATPGAPGDKEETKAATALLREELGELQARLWASKPRALLCVFQAIDAGGKDGTIRSVFSGVNPTGVQVSSFGVPTEEERRHDPLWRIHARAPGKGTIGVFNRSHYEDVLVVRVHGWVDEATWRRRYDAFNAFEEHLVAEGTTILKFFLHISKEEQRLRLQDRVDDPDERWKFRLGDLDERARWDDYQRAFADAISATSTAAAPWYVIPADRKWYRDWAVATTVVEALRAIDPSYPPAEPGVEGTVVA